MAYDYITQYNARSYTPGREGCAIDTIVVHHWDDPEKNPKFEGVLNWFCNSAPTSAHYVVEAGRVACLVSCADTAYHAGNWNMNLRSIGIECNPRASEEDKATVGELIANLQATYGNLQIIGHKDVKNTGCPGRYYPPTQILAPYIKQGGGAVASQPTPAPSTGGTDINALANAVLRGEYGNGADRRARLGGLYDAVQAVVNQKLGATGATRGAGVDINALADGVLKGLYGNGAERRQRLGVHYDAVQAEVNRRLGY